MVLKYAPRGGDALLSLEPRTRRRREPSFIPAQVTTPQEVLNDVLGLELAKAVRPAVPQRPHAPHQPLRTKYDDGSSAPADISALTENIMASARVSRAVATDAVLCDPIARA